MSHLRAHALVEAVTAVTSTDDRSTALQLVVDHACRLTGASYASLILLDGQGRPSEVFHHGHEPQPPPASSAVALPISAHGRTVALLYPGDSPDTADDGAVRALARVAGYVLDHARTAAAAERRQAWQNHAAALASTLQPPFDLDAADHALAEVAMGAAGAVASSIARLEDGEVVVTASAGRLPAWCATEDHVAAVHAALTGDKAETAAGDTHVALLAPISTHLSPAGVVAVYHRAEAPPEDFERDFLTGFAEQAALALDRARAFQEREEMALVTDRARIARELHDAVIQRLFATGLHLQKSRAMTADPELRDRLTLAMQDLDQTIRAVRQSIYDLR